MMKDKLQEGIATEAAITGAFATLAMQKAGLPITAIFKCQREAWELWATAHGVTITEDELKATVMPGFQMIANAE